MPGISPLISQRVKRPSKRGVTVLVDSHSIGSAPGPIHIVFLPCQTPTSSLSRSCILPGVTAATNASRSAFVQPGGSLGSPGAAALAAGFAFLGLESLGGSARAIRPAVRPRIATKAVENKRVRDMATLQKRGEKVFRVAAGVRRVRFPDQACLTMVRQACRSIFQKGECSILRWTVLS